MTDWTLDDDGEKHTILGQIVGEEGELFIVVPADRSLSDAKAVLLQDSDSRTVLGHPKIEGKFDVRTKLREYQKFDNIAGGIDINHTYPYD